MLLDFQVFHNGLTMRFERTPDTNTLTLDSFELWEGSDFLTSPFKLLDISRHYNSLTLSLTLYFDFTLKENTVYTFRIINGSILDIGGVSLGDFESTFAVVTSDDFSQTVDHELGEPPPETYPDVDYELEPVQIVDYSIRHDVFSGGQLISTDEQQPFRIVATTPSNDDIFISQDFNAGTINLWFTKRPDPEFVNPALFRVQKKKIGVGHRWEDISGARIDLHVDHPLVTISIPALKRTNVYNTIGLDYFEKGFKYRVRIAGYLPAEN